MPLRDEKVHKLCTFSVNVTHTQHPNTRLHQRIRFYFRKMAHNTAADEDHASAWMMRILRTARVCL